MLLGRVMVSGIGLLVSTVFIAASATMNYSYLSRQAETAWEGQIFGAVAIAVTIYNAAGFFFIRWGWENGKRKLFVPSCAVLQAVFLLFSLSCALGFASTNRGAVTGSREAQAARLASAEADLKDTEVPDYPTACAILRVLRGLGAARVATEARRASISGSWKRRLKRYWNSAR